MKKTLALIALLPTAIWAQDFGSQIETRQYAFTQIEQLSKQAEKTFDGSATDWHALEKLGGELVRYSAQLHDAFPVGSHVNSKTKQEAWTKPENFNHLLMEMDQGFKALYQASQMQQASQAEQGLEQAQSTCRSCHRAYRSRW